MLSEMPEIDRDKCDGCGKCVSVCPCHRLVIVENVITLSEQPKCAGCSRWCVECELVCPNQAITCPFEIVVEE